MRAIGATPRVTTAIRKADALPTLLPGGKFRKGAVPTAEVDAGSSLAIAKVTARTAARTYTIDLYSRWESDWSVSNTYRTVTGTTMQTPGLDDAAAADQLAVGTILLVTQANIAGTTVYVPSEHIGLV